MASSSQLFCSFRAIGFCSNHVPLVALTKGTDSFVATAIGRSFHVYLCDKLRLLFVGEIQPSPLQCLVLQGQLVFAACGTVVKAFKRGKEVDAYLGHEGEVQILLPFGEHLVSIDDKNCLKTWHVRDRELYGDILFDAETFQVMCAVHPSTYLNKILLGSQQGQLQLWNIRTNKLIYTFTGWGSPVLVLSQSPAVDVVGVGLESGDIVLHNLRYDETLMKFHQDWGPVIAISFRTDGINTVASSSPLGHIAVWDLDNRRLGAVIRDAHNGSVPGLHFLQSQPLLVTSGPDNSLKMWIFDQSDGSARLLRSRCGHSAPPTKIRFYTKGGLGLLSAGLDNSLRTFAVNKDVQMNAELSQGLHRTSLPDPHQEQQESVWARDECSLVKKSRVRGVKVEHMKLPAIIDFASEDTRAHQWDSVVTCHSGSHDSAHTWHLHNCSIGKHTLVSKHVDQGAKPQCVTITSCGNFAIIGMNTGHVEMFNMQSGIHRGEFGKPKAHTRPVRGITVDGLNMEVISASSDCTVKFWSFHQKKLLHTLALELPVAKTVYHRESAMLGVSCDNFTLLVVDTDTRRVVRTFSGHRNRVTDMAFSPDGRWLVSSAMDCSIRIWDLPTGRLIDCFLVDSPATSISFSPTGDFLASTHVDDLGIYLWSNKFLYSNVSLRPLSSDFTPSLIELPTTRAPEEERGEEREGEEVSDGGKERPSEAEGTLSEDLLDPSSPLAEGLVTLSSLPKSRWSNLQHLDVIKQHNKPVEPPKQLRPAPFFLPTLPGLQPKFIPEGEGDLPSSEASASKIVNFGKLKPLSEFQKCLLQCATAMEFNPLMDMLKTMSPASIDGEFRSLAPEAGGSLEQIGHFMHFLLSQLKTKKNFELVEAYLGLFLKLHSSLISQNQELVEVTEQLLAEHTATWKHIQTDLNMSACLLSYCRSATV